MSDVAPPIPHRAGLNALNFFTAATQTGFGPFLTVYLTEGGWSQTGIGVALSVGTVAAIVSQLPGGALVDTIHRKRVAVASGLVLVGISAVLLAVRPTVVPVWTAQLLHALAGSVLTPAVAALTLALCGHARFSEQLGSNSRYASLGNAAAAGLLGAFATYRSDRVVFIITALLVLPALAALLTIRPDHIDPERDHPALLHPKARRAREHRSWHIFAELHLHTFAICIVLFHLANAAMLPLALNLMAQRGVETGFVISGAVIVPQIVVAIASPWAGRLAERIGRRPLLIAGFAALPVRGLLFATSPAAVPLVAIQVLDGVSATVLGIMIPLVAADLTRRSGYLNLAIGSLGLAASLGATISTTVAGWTADRAGAAAAFLLLAAAGAAAFAVIWLAMPETRPARPATAPPGAAHA